MKPLCPITLLEDLEAKVVKRDIQKAKGIFMAINHLASSGFIKYKDVEEAIEPLHKVIPNKQLELPIG